MKIMVPILIGLVVFAHTSKLYCQDKAYSALKKGDTLPEIQLKIHRDTSTELISLKKFKGKLVLLDFWGVNCADCIASMPEMLAMQKQFEDRIQILVVTKNTKEEVQRLWRKFAKGTVSSKWVNAGKQLPFVMGDTVLSSLFPHRVLPTHVWIDTNQMLQAIAYKETTTVGTIQAFIDGKKVKLSEQRYLEVNLDAPLTWLQDQTFAAEKTPYYSFVTNHIEYGNGTRKPFKIFNDSLSNRVTGISCINHGILDLYKIAYKEQLPAASDPSNNRIVIEAKYPERFFPNHNSYQDWANDNTYCYALKTPIFTTGKFYGAMKADLDMFFGLQTRVEKRTVYCWVLKRIGSLEKLKTHGGIEKFESRSDWFVMQNMESRHLFRALKNVVSFHYRESPFLDEMNFSGSIDIKLPWNEKLEKVSLQKLQRSLRHYGLELVQECRDIDMLVIIEG